MKKIKMIIALMLLCVGSVYSQNIPVQQDDPNLPKDVFPRSTNLAPSVYLEGTVFTIDYPMPTVSQVIIRDAETDAVVYSASYDATRQVVINLSSLPEGTYEIRLYAFGKWWWGEFTIEIN